jgi:hypothetical protein
MVMADEYDTKPEDARDEDDRFRRIRARFKSCVDREGDMRQDWKDDFEFAWVAGKQWDTHFGQMRGDRPKYEFNKLRQAIKQVVNDNRQNTPSIKVRAVEGGDVDLAEVRQGMIRNIEDASKADEAYDWGALYAITSGFGCWGVEIAYVDDDAFDQDIRIVRKHNPWGIWFGPSRELDRSDAPYAFEEDMISREDFADRWPEADCVDFDSGVSYNDWFQKDQVRICRYWEKTRVKREMLQLSDGRVVAADDWDERNPGVMPDGAVIAVVNRRKIETTKLTVELLSGKETLEGPIDWPDTEIPLIPCWGDIVAVDGKDVISGMVRPARDAQTLYNFERSNFAEVIATQPHSPFMYTAKHIKGYEREWSGLATDNAPGLPVNVDPDFPGGLPKREMPPQMSPGYMAALRLSSDDLKAVTGIYDPSLGARSNETSGRAILARQREGDVANYDYSDNIARAIRRTGEIVNRLIPKVYTNERQIRILGEDGAERYIQINHLELDQATNQWRAVNGSVVGPDGKTLEVYDITQGKYDVSIAAGPSYTTQRMETLDAMMQLAQSQGPVAMLAQYGVLKNMDTPGTREMVEAIRLLLVSQGLLQPEEGDQPPAPPPPNPKDVAAAEKDAAQAAKYGAEAQQTQFETQREMFATQLLLQPPPQPPPIPIAPMFPNQPPQGGFFVPGANGQA